MSPLPEHDNAGSPVIGIVLMTGITTILAMLVLLMCLGFPLPFGEEQVPDIFKIVNVNHFDKNGKLDYNSYVVLKNTAKKSYLNRYLNVKLFVNGKKINCNLVTLNGYAFCSSNHYGIQNIGGEGTKGNKYPSLARWYEGQELWIDFNDRTFYPNDTICIEVYDSITDRIVSRDTWPAQKKYTTQWFYDYFLNPQAA